MINKVIFEFEFTILINLIFFKIFIWDVPTLRPLPFILKKSYFQKCYEGLLLQFYQQVSFRTFESRQVKSSRTWLWSNSLFWKYIPTVIKIFYLVFYYSFAEASKFFIFQQWYHIFSYLHNHLCLLLLFIRCWAVFVVRIFCRISFNLLKSYPQNFFRNLVENAATDNKYIIFGLIVFPFLRFLQMGLYHLSVGRYVLYSFDLV